MAEEAAPENLIDYLELCQLDAYHPDEQYLNKETVQRVREAGYYINAYTVNDPLRQKELFGWGVNGVFTDYLE